MSPCLILLLLFSPELRFHERMTDTAAARITLEIPPEWSKFLDERGFEAWPEYFKVFFGEQAQQLAILGDYERKDGKVVFTPRFEFLGGQVYLAEFDLELFLRDMAFSLPTAQDPASMPLRLRFVPQLRLPPEPPQVVGIEPRLERLPANALRVYLRFSQPLMEGSSREAIRLLEAPEAEGEDWEEEQQAFVEMREELWSPDRTRLTLFFDPGRLKRGVGPRESAGTPLRPGKRYRLSVAPMPSAYGGSRMSQAFQWEFEALPEDRTCPNPASWKIEVPKTGSQDELVIRFDEPLDVGMLMHHFQLSGPFEAGEKASELTGLWQPSADGTLLAFRVGQAWRAGHYQLRFGSQLEDLAGNRISRPFDDQKLPGEGEEKILTLPFQLH